MAAEPPAPPPLGARCARHPDAPAVALCARCGTFLCGECTELRGETAYCASCVDILRRTGPPSRRVQALIALGVAGLLVCLIPFPLMGFPPVLSMLSLGFALTTVRRELLRIANGEAPLQGRTQARVAFALGLANILPILLWAAMLAFVFFGFIRR